MGSQAKVPVFTDTNLGTHIAIDVFPNITAGDFKREIERAHLNCFPNVGEIRVNGLMQVKRKKCFYHLPDSFPIKHAFKGSKRTWFVHMEACSRTGSDMSGFSGCMAAEIRDRTSNSSNIIDSLEPQKRGINTTKNNAHCQGKKRGIGRISHVKAVLQVILGTVHLSKRKKRKRVKVKQNHYLHQGLEKGHLGRNEGVDVKEREVFAHRTETEHREEGESGAKLENLSETLSETVSVSGIIKKYFSDYEEVTLSSDFMSRPNQSQSEAQLRGGTNDNSSDAKASTTPQFTPKTPPRILLLPLPTDLSCKTSRDKIKRTEVGKHLLLASNNLSISARMPKSATGLYRHRDRKLPVLPKSSSLVRSMVFEISDNDE